MCIVLQVGHVRDTRQSQDTGQLATLIFVVKIRGEILDWFDQDGSRRHDGICVCVLAVGRGRVVGRVAPYRRRCERAPTTRSITTTTTNTPPTLPPTSTPVVLLLLLPLLEDDAIPGSSGAVVGSGVGSSGIAVGASVGSSSVAPRQTQSSFA
jgi:hypothetical protein